MTDYPGYDNPQLVLNPGHTTGHRVHGAAIVRCNTCDRPVDTSGEHWTLFTGRQPRSDLRGVAHNDADSDDAGACFTALRQCWLDLAARHAAGLLHRRRDSTYSTLRDDDLHCGTPLQILTADGYWLTGQYESAHSPQGPQPALYISLGGLNNPTPPSTFPSMRCSATRPATAELIDRSTQLADDCRIIWSTCSRTCGFIDGIPQHLWQ